MISIRRAEDRGHANHGWLDTYHTFSFADYYEADYMGFSVLRVINQDRVAPGRGFPTHGHKHMEIISYVLEGALEHEDSNGNRSLMRPGEVQLMSAGKGIRHSEFNASDTETLEFLQMWVLPSEMDTKPRYQQKVFPQDERRERLRVVVSPDGREDSLTICQDVCLYASSLSAGSTLEYSLAEGRCAWLQVARGSLTLNGESLGPGDGAGIPKEKVLKLEGVEEAELLLFDLP